MPLLADDETNCGAVTKTKWRKFHNGSVMLELNVPKCIA